MEKRYTKTQDGSYTLFSDQYQQNFHSVKDGAMNESLYKHVIPMYNIFHNKNEIHILDICFGLGYNIFATIYYFRSQNKSTKLFFYSPELDSNLIKSLNSFEYPEELSFANQIIMALIKDGKYTDEYIEIELFIGDARKYIKSLKNPIDVVYQDAFSSDVNKELWTVEYFSDIKKVLSRKALITTYSIATPVRLAMYENNFRIYEYQTKLKRKSTLATTFDINDLFLVKYIDMELKKKNNPKAKALIDNFTQV